MNFLKTILDLTHTATATVSCNQGAVCDTGLPKVNGGQITNILQIVFGVAGALALLIIIIAALRFITSNGDPQGVAQARNAIIYAAIGLVVCIFAEVIVSFVLTNL